MASSSVYHIDLDSQYVPDICEKPNQPTKFNFPKSVFGAKESVHRSFKPQWLEKWSWIHYKEAHNLAFCFICVKATHAKNLMTAKTSNMSFMSRGYCNWKDATGEKAGFCRHEASGCHKAAVEPVATLSKATGNVGELLSSVHANKKASNRKNVLTVA